MLNFDFNMISTLERGVNFKTFASINMILEKIFQHLNYSDYNPMLMSSLNMITKKNQLSNIKDYFKISYSEKFDQSH